MCARRSLGFPMYKIMSSQIETVLFLFNLMPFVSLFCLTALARPSVQGWIEVASKDILVWPLIVRENIQYFMIKYNLVVDFSLMTFIKLTNYASLLSVFIQTGCWILCIYWDDPMVFDLILLMSCARIWYQNTLKRQNQFSQAKFHLSDSPTSCFLLKLEIHADRMHAWIWFASPNSKTCHPKPGCAFHK